MLALFPLVFFFQFLYYTDLPCIVFVLATHLVGLLFRHGCICRGQTVRLNVVHLIYVSGAHPCWKC